MSRRMFLIKKIHDLMSNSGCADEISKIESKLCPIGKRKYYYQMGTKELQEIYNHLKKIYIYNKPTKTYENRLKIMLDNIADDMRNKNITRKEMAADLNLTQTTLSHFFKGKQGTFVTIKKIIDYIENY